MKINRTLLLVLIWFGIIEGLSTLFLFFVAMPMKYMYDQPMGVQIAGPVHGFLFLGLVMLLIIGKYKIPLTTKTFIWGLIGSVLPLGPFIVDVTLYKLLKK
jgi:integral membrane protein